MIELFKNPVTVIFGLLTVFFVCMSLGRHLIRRRYLRDGMPKEKPYVVSDPYTEPEAVVTVDPFSVEPGTSAQASPAPNRYFREFGQPSKTSSTAPDKNTSGYAWE